MAAVSGLIAAIIALVVGGVTTLWLWRKLQMLNTAVKTLSKDLLQLKKEQVAALNGSYGMGQRMLRLERRLKTLAETPTPEPVDETPFSYTQAAQMIREGADVETVAATCGLSHSEAHLMRKLCAEGLTELDTSGY